MILHTDHRSATLAFALAALIYVAMPSAPVTANPGTRSDGRSRYAAIAPCRLADTRLPASGYARINPSVIRIQVTGRCDVSASTTAVALSVTVTGTDTEGYAVVTAARTSGPTSTINWAPGETRASSTDIGVSPTGAIDVQVSPSFDVAAVIVDVTAAWVIVSGSVRGDDWSRSRVAACWIRDRRLAKSPPAIRSLLIAPPSASRSPRWPSRER